jgi:hypothetical protein
MKIDYDKTIDQLDGPPYTIETAPGVPKKNLTLRTAIIFACSTALQTDEAMSMVDKFKIGECAMLAHKGLDLAVEQVALMKERTAKVFNSPTLVYLLNEAFEAQAPTTAPALVPKSKK